MSRIEPSVRVGVVAGRCIRLERPRRAVALAAAAAATAALSLTACGGGHSSPPAHTTQPVTSTRAPSSRVAPSSPSKVIKPSVTTPSLSRSSSPINGPATSAVAAYRALSAADNAAEAKPADARLRKQIVAYAFDPLRGQLTGYLVSLSTQGVAWRGSPPQPRVSVVSVKSSASPWPQVMLSDCPTPAPTWQEYVVKTGKVVPPAPSQVTVPPPYRIAVELIFYQGHWGVRSTTPDTSRTCTG